MKREELKLNDPLNKALEVAKAFGLSEEEAVKALAFSKKTAISKEVLIEWGMVETTFPDSIVVPLSKVIYEDDNDNKISIDIDMSRNEPELVLKLHDGAMIYLNVTTIEELDAFAKCLGEFESN